jgi:hypothetical protein
MIFLITPTGARQMQFSLCQNYMRRQTYHGAVGWIIIDDSIPRCTDMVVADFKPNWTIIKVYPSPPWRPGQNTQARNTMAGIKVLTDNYKKEDIEAIFIIEDDDYYRPQYLERMMANFQSYHLIGERNTIYYNVQWRRYITNPNTIHASLFQTAFKYDVIDTFKECIPNTFMDCVFWSRVANKHLFYENDLAVGMKGMPGRGGIGAGHTRAMNMHSDISLSYLRRLIGDDAKNYESYYKSAQDFNNRRQLFVK